MIFIRVKSRSMFTKIIAQKCVSKLEYIHMNLYFRKQGNFFTCASSNGFTSGSLLWKKNSSTRGRMTGTRSKCARWVPSYGLLTIKKSFLIVSIGFNECELLCSGMRFASGMMLLICSFNVCKCCSLLKSGCNSKSDVCKSGKHFELKDANFQGWTTCLACKGNIKVSQRTKVVTD